MKKTILLVIVLLTSAQLAVYGETDKTKTSKDASEQSAADDKKLAEERKKVEERKKEGKTPYYLYIGCDFLRAFEFKYNELSGTYSLKYNF